MQNIIYFGTVLYNINYSYSIIIILFFFHNRRFEKLRAKNPNFKERWAHLGQLPSQTAFDWEKEVETEAADNEVNYT